MYNKAILLLFITVLSMYHPLKDISVVISSDCRQQRSQQSGQHIPSGEINSSHLHATKMKLSFYSGLEKSGFKRIQDLNFLNIRKLFDQSI